MRRAGSGSRCSRFGERWCAGVAPLVAPVLATLLGACSPSPTMRGEVRDNFGTPLPDVAVSIDKTDYTAKTDANGRYTVRFDPGAVNIRFVKDGYAEGHFGVRLPSTKPQRIDVVTLQKALPGPGVWLVAGGAYAAAARCELRQESLTTGRRPTTISAVGDPPLVNAAGAPPHLVTFVDNHPWAGGAVVVPLLYKIIGGSEIFRVETVGVTVTTSVDQQRLEDAPKPDANTGKWFASRLADGTYVYAARTLISGVGFGPDVKNACFMFKVGGPN